MKNLLLVQLVMLLGIQVNAQTKPAVTAKPVVAKPIFKNTLDSFSYAAGYSVANNMKSQNISKINTAIMLRAIEDVYKGRQPLLSVQDMNNSMQKQVQAFTKESATAEIAKGKAFLAANKQRKEITTLPDGLQYEILKRSDNPGIKPRPIDTVVVNYIGTLTDGTEFENSYKVGEPVVFPLNMVIAGWVEVLQLMTPGDKWKVYVPTELGYYLSPRDPKTIPPGAALIFEITLENVKPVK